VEGYEKRSLITQRYSPRIGWPLAGALVILLTAFDVLEGSRANLSILYILPMVLFAQSAPRRGLILVAGAVLVVLTYGCFLVKYHQHMVMQQFLVSGITNRSFAAGSNAVSAVLLYSWVHFRAYWEARYEHLTATDMDAFIFNQIFQSLEHLVAVILCLILTAATAAMDLVTPGEFNFAILYAVPVVIVGLTEHRLSIWIMVIMGVTLSLVGYLWGAPATAGVPQQIAQSYWNNRMMACCMLVGTGLVMHLGVRSRGLSQRIEDSIMTRGFI